MAHSITKSIQKISITRDQATFFTFAGLVFILLFTYAYFVNATVRSVVHREAMEDKMGTLHSDVSELEARYLAEIEHLDKKLAQQKGFTEAPVYFVERVSTGREVAQAER